MTHPCGSTGCHLYSTTGVDPYCLKNCLRRFPGRKITETPKRAVCTHSWIPTFQGGDTYRCKKCGKEIDMTEDEEP